MKNRNPQNRMVFGAILLIFGVLALVDNLNLFNTREIFRFWPTIFIIVGALKISRSDSVGGNVIGGAFVMIGVTMILQNLGIVYFRNRDIWPLFLILAGLFVIFRDKLNAQPWGKIPSGDSPEAICNVSAVMSGAKLQNSSQQFAGGELTAVMGGIQLDLSRASLGQSATLNVFAMWGGIELRIPPDWTVISQGVPILGGFEDKTIPPMNNDKKLYIQGYAIMGGVEIKN